MEKEIKPEDELTITIPTSGASMKLKLDIAGLSKEQRYDLGMKMMKLYTYTVGIKESQNESHELSGDAFE